MAGKAAVLVIIVGVVLAYPVPNEECKLNHEHTQAICSNFKLTLTKGLDFNLNVNQLIFDNVKGHLNLSGIPSLSNLTYLSISNSKIDNITLGVSPNLYFLVFLKNKKLPNLTRDLFVRSNEHLNWLSLISNNHTIEPNSLHFLKNLTWLHIQNQKFQHLTGDFLKHAIQLHELTIRNCRLKQIDSNAFDNSQEIEILSFNFNKIRHFEAGTFKNLKRLKILELHHNDFIDFNLEQFWGLSSLEILGLPSNFLKNIDRSDDLLSVFPNLTKMEIMRRDLIKNETKPLIAELRAKKIHIIGTPHDQPPFLHQVQQSA